MVLEKYSKADLKSIVQIYNLGLDESEIKKKKSELIKAMKGVKAKRTKMMTNNLK